MPSKRNRGSSRKSGSSEDEDWDLPSPAKVPNIMDPYQGMGNLENSHGADNFPYIPPNFERLAHMHDHPLEDISSIAAMAEVAHAIYLQLLHLGDTVIAFVPAYYPNPADVSIAAIRHDVDQMLYAANICHNHVVDCHCMVSKSIEDTGEPTIEEACLDMLTEDSRLLQQLIRTLYDTVKDILDTLPRDIHQQFREITANVAIFDSALSDLLVDVNFEDSSSYSDSEGEHYLENDDDLGSDAMSNVSNSVSELERSLADMLDDSDSTDGSSEGSYTDLDSSFITYDSDY